MDVLRDGVVHGRRFRAVTRVDTVSRVSLATVLVSGKCHEPSAATENRMVLCSQRVGPLFAIAAPVCSHQDRPTGLPHP